MSHVIGHIDDPNDPLGLKRFGGGSTPALPAPAASSFNSAGLDTNFLLSNTGRNLALPGSTGDGGSGGGSGFGLNLDTFNLAGSALGGLGKLASGWAAIKGLGLAKNQLAQGQEQFDKNFGMQTRAFDANVVEANNRIRDQNAWKTAQGRTDLAKLVV